MYIFNAAESDFELIYETMKRARQKLFNEGIYQWDETYPTAQMILNDIKNRYTYLVKADEKVVGFYTSNSIIEDDVHDNVQWIYAGEKWIVLHRLCVDVDVQGKGIGQEILMDFEKRAKENEFESIRIDVFATNKAAIHIYEKFGYTLVGDAACDRGPFLIYEKRI